MRHINLLYSCLLGNLLAVPSSSAPDVNLPLGDVNVLVLTDTHSWVAGHGYHEEDLNADYGDVCSFYERLKYACHENGKDLWFVMNGDIVHGTGLSNNPPVSLVPLLEKMPWDAVNIGNHELKEDQTVEYLLRPGGFIEWWGDNYLTSNVVLASNGQSLGQRYHLLHGKYQDSTVLTFGFLFDMADASSLVTVERVEDVVKSNWFVKALRDNSFDAVMVLAHMDFKDRLVSVILSAIRKECGSKMPVQFITGHTHYRGRAMVDDFCCSFEAGRYLDTVGFVSFPLKQSNGTFNHTFMDANKDVLRSTLGVETLATESGTALSDFIRDTQDGLGLLDVVGCSPTHFKLKAALNQTDSLWGLYLTSVVPNQLFGGDATKVLVQRIPSYFWYDLFSDRVTVTDIASVVPLDDAIYHLLSNVKGADVKAIVQALDTEEYMHGLLPSFWFSGDLQDDEAYDLYTIESDVERVVDTLTSLGIGSDKPQELNKGNHTVRSIWTEYVAENWPCKGKPKQPSSPGTPNTSQNVRHPDRSFWKAAAIAVVVIALSLLVVRYAPRWLQRCLFLRDSIRTGEEEEITLVI